MDLPEVKIKIVQFPAMVLRQVSRPVGDADYNIKQLVDAMVSTMASSNGLGLSAIQVGAPLRIFVLDGKLVSEGAQPLVFINPEIVELSEEQQVAEEGCLSFAGVTMTIPRATTARVRAWNREGKMFELSGHGLLARALQHEYEHLDGKLFIDHLPIMKRDILKRKLTKRAKLVERVALQKKKRLVH